MTSRAAPMGAVAAVDLGASSGRVLVGRAGPGFLELHEVHRFTNEPVTLPDGLHWDVLRLFDETLRGLRLAGRLEPLLRSVGVDAWAVDYGLLDGDGRLLGNPYHYRDRRTKRGVAAVHDRISPDDLYGRTGLQFLPFNTLYQLAASRGTPELDAAATLLLIPDLIGFWLTGRRFTEMTNASTTGLVDPSFTGWARDLLDLLDIEPSILPGIRAPGERIGGLLPAVLEATGLTGAVELTLVGSHDTASAVVGVPAEEESFAYISCGTWALVGVELDRPILTDASREANFTNEAGVDGRIRYLRNVAGLWLLQESVRAWEKTGAIVDLDALLEAASELAPGGPRIDPDDPRFVAPGDMPTRIRDACRESGQPIPESPQALVRCVLDSLAVAFARSVRLAATLCAREVRVVHLVGGGSRNPLLCQLTADACNLPVIAGPAEATAIGNVLVQARAHGFIEGDLSELRALVRATQPLRRYEAAMST